MTTLLGHSSDDKAREEVRPASKGYIETIYYAFDRANVKKVFSSTRFSARHFHGLKVPAVPGQTK